MSGTAVAPPVFAVSSRSGLQCAAGFDLGRDGDTDLVAAFPTAVGPATVVAYLNVNGTGQAWSSRDLFKRSEQTRARRSGGGAAARS